MMRATPRTSHDGHARDASVRVGADGVQNPSMMDTVKQYAPEIGLGVGLVGGVLIGGMTVLPAAVGAAIGGAAGYFYKNGTGIT